MTALKTGTAVLALAQIWDDVEGGDLVAEAGELGQVVMAGTWPTVRWSSGRITDCAPGEIEDVPGLIPMRPALAA